MTTLSVLPAYPVPGRSCTLAFALDDNYAKVWCTLAPQGSALRSKLDASTTNPKRIHIGDIEANTPIPFIPDKGGVYTFLVQEYKKGQTPYGGSYEGDVNSNDSEAAGAETTLSLQVGQKISQKIGKSPDQGTLSLYVFGNNIRATTVAVHGEATPSLTVPASSPKARIAVEDSAVQSALLSLVDANVVTALGNIANIVSDFGFKINAHVVDSAVHQNADHANKIPVGSYGSVSPKDLAKAVNVIIGDLNRHYTNDDGGHTTGVTPGPDSASYHEVSGTLRNDIIDLPIFDSVGDLESAYGALADIFRSYEAHRQSAVVHIHAGSSHVLNPLPLVLTLHKAFISVLASIAPTVPVTINSGVVSAVSIAGFKEV